MNGLTGLIKLRDFRGVWKQYQPRLPGMPKAPPQGYKPAGLFDPSREPGGRGYREGTVRRWANGLHIKIKGEWFPYDEEHHAILRGNKWVPLKQPRQQREISVLTDKQLLDVEREAFRLADAAENGEIDGEEAANGLKDIISGLIDMCNDVAEMSPVLKRTNQFFEMNDYHDIGAAYENMDPDDPESLLAVAEAIGEFLNSPDFDMFMELAEGMSKLTTEKRKKIGGREDPDLVKKGGFFAKAARPAKLEMLGTQGIASTCLLRTTEDGTKAVQKFDVLAAENGQMRSTLMTDAPPSQREAAAYELAKLFGWKIVPETGVIHDNLPDSDTLKKVINKEGAEFISYSKVADPDAVYQASCQRFVEDSSALADACSDIKFQQVDPEYIRERFGETAEQDAWRISAFHILTCNTDGHPGNILVDKSGHLYAIDNSLSFGGEKEFLSIFSDFKAEEMPDEVKRELRQVKPEQIRQALEPYGLGDAAEAVEKRLKRLIDLTGG